MCYWIIQICLILKFVAVNSNRGGHGHGHGHGGGHGGWGQGQNHHHNPGFGGWGDGNGIYPQFGGGWTPQIYSPNRYDQITAPTYTPAHQCVRPSFTDNDAELIIEKCDTDSVNSACLDSSMGIPIGWKVFMACRRENIRIKQPSTCSSTGEWTNAFPSNCTPLFEKYDSISEMDDFKKIPLAVHPVQITSTLRSTTTTVEEGLQSEDIFIPHLRLHEKECSMLVMKLSDNFMFSCFMHHQSSVETHECLTTHPKVPAGTIAVLRCRPPFYNRDGNISQWVCEEGTWNGDFDTKLKCIYSKVPIKTRLKSTTTIRPTLSTTAVYHRQTTTTPTPTPFHHIVQKVSPTTTSRPFIKVSTTTSRPFIKFSTTTSRPFITVSTTTKSDYEYDYDYGEESVLINNATTQRTTTSTTPSTTTKRTIILTKPTTTSKPPTSSAFFSEKVVCPPLKPRSVGVILECVSKTKASSTQSEQIFVNGCDISQPVGAEAKYACRQFYESTGGFVNIYRKCKDDGTWTGSADSFSCVPECGGKNEVLVPFITFGTPAIKGEWPWHAALFQKEAKKEGSWEYICGGTLISKKTILTAAHCVTFQASSSPRNVSSLRFDLGRFELDKVDDLIQTKEVESIYVHPSYSPFGYDSDIAIIILTEAVGVGYHVRPICFPQTLNTAQEELMLGEGSLGTVAGWGKTETDVLSNQLHTAKLRLVSQKECSAGTRGIGGGRLQIKSTTYCAAPGMKNGTELDSSFVNVCNGDSGGGMYFPQTTSDSTSTRWYIQGIVSVGIGDDNNKCQPNQYSFFTRVGRYADWLTRVMSENDAL